MSQQLITAKKIYTLANPHEFFTAMVIEDGRIVELAQKEQIIFEKRKFSDIKDFSGFTIIPGFNDSHIHALSYGNFLNNINFIGCSKDEFIKKIKEKIKSLSKNEWILGRGWDHEIFEDGILPSRKDLDAISKDHPMFFKRICGHIGVANSKALELANIKKETPNPERGKIDRDEKTGEPTGIIRENALELLNNSIPEPNFDKKIQFLRDSLNGLNKAGITSFQTISEEKSEYELYKYLHSKGELTSRVYLTPRVKELPELIKKGIKTNQGDDFLRWGRIKIFSDGSLGAETAALFDNYENSSNNGMLLYTDKILIESVSKAYVNGWQLEIHAIGDRSALQVINAFEKTGAYTNRAVLTHCQILNQEIINKMAKLGIIANIQPIFLNTDLHWAEKKIGTARMRYSYVWKTLLDSSIHCAGGSDSPVEKPDPLLGIHAAVNRQDNNGYPAEGWYNEQALSVWQAVQLYTSYSAYAEFQEHQKGKLLPNYLADFIVLDKDIFEIPKSDLRTIRIMSTFVGGNQVYNTPV